MGVGNFAYFCH